MASGVDTSEWECPCDIDELEEWVVQEDWECEVCEQEHPAGTTFYGNRGEEWDVCDYCYKGQEKDTTLSEQVSPTEMAKRMQQLSVIEADRQTENANAESASKAFEKTNEGTTSSAVAARTRFHFKPGMRVSSFVPVLGNKSANESFGNVDSINSDGTLNVQFDMGRLGKSINPGWARMLTPEAEAAYNRQKMLVADRHAQAEDAEKRARTHEILLNKPFELEDTVLYMHPSEGWKAGHIIGVDNRGDSITYDIQGRKEGKARNRDRAEWYRGWTTDRMKQNPGGPRYRVKK